MNFKCLRDKTNLKTLLYILAFIPAFICLFCLYKYGVNIIFADEYDVVNWSQFFSNDPYPFASFFNQHNEHRIFFPRFIYYFIAKITNVDVKWQLYFTWSVFLAVSLLFVFYLKNFKTKLGVKLFSIFLLNCLIFSLCQYENMFWGFQVGFACVFGFAIFSFYFFYKFFEEESIKVKTVYCIICLFFYVLAAFSSAQGLLVGLIIQFVTVIILKFKFIKSKFFWFLLFFNVCVWFLYLNNYGNVGTNTTFETASNRPLELLYHPIDALNYFFLFFVSPFGIKYGPFSIIFGIIVLLLVVYELFDFLKKRNTLQIFPICLILFCLLVCLGIASQRLIIGVEQASASRYTTFSLLIYESLILLLFLRKINLWQIFILVVISVSFVYSIHISRNGMVNWHNMLVDQRNTFLNYKYESEDSLRKLIMPSFFTKQVASLFESNNAGPFYYDYESLGYEIDDSSKYSWCIDHISYNNKYVLVVGWFFKKGIDIDSNKVSIVFRDIGTNEMIVLPTLTLKRSDITRVFNDGHNYDYSGFKAEIPYSSLIDFDKTNYQIYVLYHDINGDKLINLNEVLKKQR